ncbi:MAG TPA: deoxyhypusine synthase family protein [Solirubrobacteraceae bacterium]|jgi:deoxyhypusine synthase|nr:deoxyhypusine synthase family protein [Solirubrobacteraceae bacterium]
MTSLRAFMDHNFRHFNSRETLEAAQAYDSHINDGGKMLVAMGGAMSTGRIGLTLARMIREDKVHAISCTAANMEEDIFNLIARPQYEMVRNYRDLTPEDETEIANRHLYRVTDTAIPVAPMITVEELLTELWEEAVEEEEPRFPWEFFYELIREGKLEPHYAIDPAESWMLAACEKDIPVYSPGFEDSTLGNSYTALVISEDLEDHYGVKPGTEQMQHLVEWYLENCGGKGVGFFQIGGGIAGDFAICAVPLIIEDLERPDTPLWTYFAQIGDSTTSYGSYSGAVPNEKITWHKLDASTPRYMINSDASIVAPLIFGYVLGD